MCQFRREDADGSKMKTLALFKPIDRESKVEQNIQKSTPEVNQKGRN